jgi:predicted nucleic acid-binding protein
VGQEVAGVANAMSAFIDSNIFLYLIDPEMTSKRPVAAELMRGLYMAGQAVISTQVLQEFYNVATKKFGLPRAEVADTAQLYGQTRVVQMTPAIVFAAMRHHADGQFSFWDALIVEAALSAGCKTLYSEDMQHGLVLDGMTIENPFLGL